MYINSRILFGVRSKRDVANLSEQRKDCLLRATKAAETLLEMCLRGGTYAKNFRFGEWFTHVAAYPDVVQQTTSHVGPVVAFVGFG